MSKREQILQEVLDKKAVAVVRLNSSKNYKGMAEALIEGGISLLEITLTTPDALEIIANLKKEFGDKITVGVGSVLGSDDAKKSIEAGAEFVVSPVFLAEIIKESHNHDVPAMVGAFTPTEILAAHRAGADIVKVFPADTLGQAFFKGVLAPMPFLKLMPTGGVNLNNGGEWIRAGACAVGVGSALIDKTAIENGEFGLIKDNARRVINSLNK
ncbi:MAG: 2-dehydro-3-deoxy-phosphogluconate aldolase [Melioribacteraceae bacterium]|nr:MAG: 2-dehydro-3-deoxy-phosphogluconate aldolase [Melioribacteraceae bacterium]